MAINMTDDISIVPLKPSPCPCCGLVIDHAGETPGGDERDAEPGDILVCPGCASLLYFDGEMALAVPPAEWVAERYAEDPMLERQVALYQAAITVR